MVPSRLAGRPAHSGPAGPITDALVAIPVLEEAARVSACLSSIEQAVDALTAPHASTARDDIRAAPRVTKIECGPPRYAARGVTVRTRGRTEGRVHVVGFAGYLRSCVPSSEPEPLPALREASA
jgi:hypothetical protein